MYEYAKSNARVRKDTNTVKAYVGYIVFSNFDFENLLCSLYEECMTPQGQFKSLVIKDVFCCHDQL